MVNACDAGREGELIFRTVYCLAGYSKPIPVSYTHLVMHDILRMDEQEPFRFSWDWLAPSGLSTKDFIAPSSFEFRTGKQFRMGKKYGAVSFLQILAPELNDRLLADFLDMESSLIVSTVSYTHLGVAGAESAQGAL